MPMGTAADDDQVIGPLAQVEDRLVGVVRRVLQPRDRRHEGAGPVAITKRRALMIWAPACTSVSEMKRADLADDMDAEALEPFLAVDGFDRFDDACAHGPWRPRNPAGRVAGGSEGLLGGVMRLVARRQQRLGRDTAVVEAVPAHLVALDQDDLRAHLDRARRDGEAAGPGADDADVGLDTGHCDGPFGKD
jgi:hypothetical protein